MKDLAIAGERTCVKAAENYDQIRGEETTYLRNDPDKCGNIRRLLQHLGELIKRLTSLIPSCSDPFRDPDFAGYLGYAATEGLSPRPGCPESGPLVNDPDVT